MYVAVEPYFYFSTANDRYQSHYAIINWEITLVERLGYKLSSLVADLKYRPQEASIVLASVAASSSSR